MPGVRNRLIIARQVGELTFLREQMKEIAVALANVEGPTLLAKIEWLKDQMISRPDFQKRVTDAVATAYRQGGPLGKVSLGNL